LPSKIATSPSFPTSKLPSLKVGKDGDVAIFDGNPMEVFTKTLYTIIGGNVVYDGE